MTKTEYAQYLQSEHWQQRRKQAMVAASHACEYCGLPRWVARLVYDQDLNVHHRNYQHVGDEEPDDLEVLCRRCHDIETFGRSDFKAIKSAECSICASDHWDVYSDRCSRCKFMFPSGQEDYLFFYFEERDKNGRAFYEVLEEQFLYAIQNNYIPLDWLLESFPVILASAKAAQDFRKARGY